LVKPLWTHGEVLGCSHEFQDLPARTSEASEQPSLIDHASVGALGLDFVLLLGLVLGFLDLLLARHVLHGLEDLLELWMGNLEVSLLSSE
jgi:hypothetical protein